MKSKAAAAFIQVKRFIDSSPVEKTPVNDPIGPMVLMGLMGLIRPIRPIP
jgi:hypothetical protein